MRNIKLTISYDGTNFYGWQTQPDQRSVQQELEKIAKILFHEDVAIQGSGRTDRGVHALGQVAHFKAQTDMSCERVIRAFNANLPEDISIVNAEDVPMDFHARFSVRSKTYRYSICNAPAKPCIGRQYCFHLPYPVDLARLDRELKSIHGRHDFFSLQGSHPYQKNLTEEPDTVRTILATNIRREADMITVDIEGDGFLYKMVRNVMGISMRVATGMIPEGTLPDVLRKKDKSLVKYTAEPQGLALLRVNY